MDHLEGSISPSPIFLSQPGYDSYEVQSQSQRIFSGLLSKPDVLSKCPDKMFRAVDASFAHEEYSTSDFLQYGSKPRPSTNRKRAPTSSSRQSRTFQSRFRHFQPTLRKLVSVQWDLPPFEDILSLSTLSPCQEDLIAVGWDDDQGLGFWEYQQTIGNFFFTFKSFDVINSDKE